MSKKKKNVQRPFSEILKMAKGIERENDPNHGMLPPPRIYKSGKEYNGKSDRKSVENDKRQARYDMVS